MAIQLIINREWGLAKNENPNQGAFIIDELTELVEEAVLTEFEKIAERGGVLGAMETGYQRGKIQEESMHYEMLKHTGEYPIIGVNTFRNPHGDPVPEHIELARSTDDEKQSPAEAAARLPRAPCRARRRRCCKRLQQAVIDNRNVFEVLMDAVRVLLARADHERAVRGRRAVPAQHVAIHLLTVAQAARGFDNPAHVEVWGAVDVHQGPAPGAQGLAAVASGFRALGRTGTRGDRGRAPRRRHRRRGLGPAGASASTCCTSPRRPRQRPSSARRTTASTASGDRAGYILAGTGLARCLWREGKFAAALDQVLPLRDEGLQRAAPRAARRAAEHHRRLLFGAGRSEQAFAYMYQALRDARPAHGHGFDAVLYCNLAHELLQIGDYHEALRYVDQGICALPRI